MLQMDFNAVNKIAKLEFKPTKKVSDLTDGLIYKVSLLKQVNTKYGLKVAAELNDEFEIFLPRRLNTYFEQQKEEFLKFQEEVGNDRLYIKFHGSGNLEFCE